MTCFLLTSQKFHSPAFPLTKFPFDGALITCFVLTVMVLSASYLMAAFLCLRTFSQPACPLYPQLT